MPPPVTSAKARPLVYEFLDAAVDDVRHAFVTGSISPTITAAAIVLILFSVTLLIGIELLRAGARGCAARSR